MKKVRVIKIGGNVLDSQEVLDTFLKSFSRFEGLNILVHGGGKIASAIGKRMGIAENMLDGRRITDAETIDLVTMVYAGLINKKIVASLQTLGCNALGLSGADANILPATKRVVGITDYGFVGDIDLNQLDYWRLQPFLDAGLQLVIAPITHDNKGQLLNTNADTIAAAIAAMLAKEYSVDLFYCFEKEGVLDLDGKVIPAMNPKEYAGLKDQGVVSAGMIPKLDNAFGSIVQGVSKVIILSAAELEKNIAGENCGTQIKA